MSKYGSRKFVVALIAIAGCLVRPEAGTAVAAIAVAFLGAHAVADSKLGRANAIQAGD